MLSATCDPDTELQGLVGRDGQGRREAGVGTGIRERVARSTIPTDPQASVNLQAAAQDVPG